MKAIKVALVQVIITSEELRRIADKMDERIQTAKIGDSKTVWIHEDNGVQVHFCVDLDRSIVGG